jgi:hypothetical protein
MDMLTMTAEELLAKAEARWKQQWIYMWDLTDFTNTYDATIEARHTDDISVIVWKQN